MFAEILISLLLIVIVFGTIILFVSHPYGGTKNLLNLLRSVHIYTHGNIHNFICVVKLLKNHSIKSVHRHYPKTTDFAISSLFLIIAVVNITVIAIIADVFWK